jgi:hypothetical protein
VRAANRRLREAILRIADNLIICNDHFRQLSERWLATGKNARDIRVRIAWRFCRIAYQMVAGQQLFAHPSIKGRPCILDKLNIFHREHGTARGPVLTDLQAAFGQLPPKEYAAEAQPLQQELHKMQSGRRRGPQPLGDILPMVLAQLGVVPLQSKASGEVDPR